MSFAAAQSRVNASVLKHLANVRLTIGGGTEISGIFRNAYSTAQIGAGVASAAPSVTVDDSAIPTDPIGLAVQIVNGDAYRIADPQPDGTGLTVLILEKAT